MKYKRIYSDVSKYWEEMDKLRNENGLPAGVFDFISLHKDEPKGYSLISPMCLVEKNGMNRPSWERATFFTKADALNFARKITPSHIVCCD